MIFAAMVTPATMQVILSPAPTCVVLTGGNCTIHCLSLAGEILDSVEWIVNGSLLIVEATHNGTITEGAFENGDRYLHFTNIPQGYNSTTIQCRAQLGAEIQQTSATTLLVQGLLPAVGSLDLESNDSSIHLTWEAPFVLEGVSPDIDGYCVDVTSASHTLWSECGITSTEFNFLIPPESVCSEILFTVTPGNLVGNGTSANVTYQRNISAPHLDEVSCAFIGRNYHCVLRMTNPVCHADIRLLDLDTKENIIVEIFELMGKLINFTTQQLVDDHDYNMTVWASNIGGSDVSYEQIGNKNVTSTVTTMETASGVETASGEIRIISKSKHNILVTGVAASVFFIISIT